MDSIRSKAFNIQDCISLAEDRGYKEKFTIHARGIFHKNSTYVYSPEEIKIQSHYYYEISSSLLPFYLLETKDGRRGFLVEDDHEISGNRVRNFIREAQQHESHGRESEGWWTTFQNFLKNGK